MFLGPWLDHENFHVQVRNAWHSHDPWSANIVHLTRHFKVWNRETYGNVFKRKRRLLAHLKGIDRNLMEGPNERLSHLKRELWEQYKSLLDHEVAFWFQQSCSKWL